MTRFASLSVNPGVIEGAASRTATPLYHPRLSPTISSSHTYVNQYAGSEYHLDRVQTPQLPYIPFETDGAYDDFNKAYHNPG